MKSLTNLQKTPQPPKVTAETFKKRPDPYHKNVSQDQKRAPPKSKKVAVVEKCDRDFKVSS